MKENLIAQKTFDFAIMIIVLTAQLKNEKEFIISRQLARSGTSIGANIQEAIAVQSKRDFISKISIACKEARKTKYWLRLLQCSKITLLDIDAHLLVIDHILNILHKIIKTSSQPQSSHL